MAQIQSIIDNPGCRAAGGLSGGCVPHLSARRVGGPGFEYLNLSLHYRRAAAAVASQALSARGDGSSPRNGRRLSFSFLCTRNFGMIVGTELPTRPRVFSIGHTRRAHLSRYWSRCIQPHWASLVQPGSSSGLSKRLCGHDRRSPTWDGCAVPEHPNLINPFFILRCWESYTCAPWWDMGCCNS